MTVFKAQKLNNLFEKQGYVIVNLFGEDETNILKDFFIQQDITLNQSFTTFATNNYEYRKSIDNKLKELFYPYFHKIFNNYHPFWGNYFTKHPQSPAMPLHADLQYVEEPDEISINIWCPLVDTIPNNGALGIVPMSHKVCTQIRGINLPQFYAKNANEILEKFGEIIELKAGQAIIYNHRLLHFSNANNSSTSRLAITMIGVPVNKQLIHYAAENEKSLIQKYYIESVDDFLKTNFKEIPKHLSPKDPIHNYPFRDLTINDFEMISSKNKEVDNSVYLIDND
jgi:hypothetical protein